MKNFSKIDSFIDDLKEMRGIADLDGYLLHLLFEMKPGVSETTQKFLCLCFSLWDDGNTRIPLDVGLFKEKWFKKWNGLKKLKKSQEESFDFNKLEESFDKIIDSGIQDLNGSDFSEIIGENAPLLKVDQYLYMAKHFKAKGDIQNAMTRIFGKKNEAVAAIEEISDMTLNNEQKEAVLRGQNENLVITGGPGTGKTTVVLYILWHVLENIVKDVKTDGSASEEEVLKEYTKILSEYTIYLAAPSGKAADRMSESLKNGLNRINADLKKSPIFAKLKDLEGMTIHRLLKYSRSSNGFSYNAENLFPEKSIFVIDEASMVDVNLFSSLLQAIPSQSGDEKLVTRLFILGDPYQLPSVDAGAVLGNILNSASEANFTAKLTETIRFRPGSKIWNLAEAIKACADDQKKPAPDTTFVLHPVFSKKEGYSSETPTDAEKSDDAVYYYMLPQKSMDKDGKELDKAPTKKEEQENVTKFLENWIGDFKDLPKLVAGIDPEALENPSDELKKLCNDIWNRTLEKRILAAERRGAIGVEQINETIGNLIKEHCSKEGIKSDSRYFEGQLLILTKNQAMYKLYNGDTGIVLFKESVPYIMLKKPNGKIGEEKCDYVAYPLALLPADAVEPAFAITIHKSQGSEYDHVTMFLPSQEGHPLLNNQIVYTGITRAKKTVTIIATDETFKSACKAVIDRDTGIEL